MTNRISHIPRRAFLGGAAIFSASIALEAQGVSRAFAAPESSAEVQAEIDLVATKLADMRANLEATSDAYYKAMGESEEATKKMEEAQAKIEENTKKISQLQSTLGTRASDMYKTGPVTFLDVMLGSADFTAFIRNWDALTALNESDQDSIDETKRLRTENEDNKRVAAAQKEVAEKKAAEAAEARAQAESMVASYEATIASLSEEKQRLIEEEQRIAAEAAAEAARQRAEQEARNASNNGGASANSSSSAGAASTSNAGTGNSSAASGTTTQNKKTGGSGSIYKNNGGQSYPSVVAAAQSQLGVPYRWGGREWGVALDCSGLTMLCYKKAVGKSIGTYTEAQYAAAQSIVPLSQAQPGDVLYTYGHVGICTQAGGGQYIHAPAPGQVVSYSTWAQFYCALRY